MSTTTTPTASGYVELTEAERATLDYYAKITTADVGGRFEHAKHPDDYDVAIDRARTHGMLWRASLTGQLAPTDDVRAVLAKARAESIEYIDDETFNLERVSRDDPASHCIGKTFEETVAAFRTSIDEEKAHVAAFESILARAGA